jgi:phytoene synthase
MCIEIFGYREASAREFAKYLGNALQLVNIIRDLKEDAERGRVYLPQDELARFGYSEQQLLAGIYNENFVALMEFQCARARGFFQQAQETLAPIDRPSMVAAQIMGSIYFKILERIEAARYDVFNHRIKLNKLEKGLIALRAWAKCRL